MATPVILPKFSMTMEDATVLRWLKVEGDRVEKDEPLLEVMTEKVDMEVEAPASGVLRGIRAKPGDVVPATQVIAYVLAEGEELPAGEVVGAAPAAAAAARVAAIPTGAAGYAGGEAVTAVPAARRLAREEGIDLTTIVGTGPSGRITEADVQAAITRAGSPSAAPTPASAASTRAAGHRRTIARRMTASAREIPHVYLLRSVDITNAAMARGEATITAVIVWAAAQALRAHPLMRAALEGEDVVVHEAVHIGVAVDAPVGLVVPVVRDADRKDLSTLHSEIERLAARARDGTLTLDEVTGATFTISNLGMFGVDAFTALINPPQSAILAVGAVTPRPWAVGETVAVRQVCELVLGIDHRISDGAAGARFLDELCRHLATMPSLIRADDER